jgi:hypothetical protein
MRMSHDEIEQVNIERLLSWVRRLTAAEATPVLLVGVGQGADNGGTFHLIIPEHNLFSRPMLRALLREVLADLERQR